MSAMSSPAQSEISKGLLPLKPLVEVLSIGPDDLKNDRFPGGRPSLGRRAPLVLARFLITFCIGVAATLAWLSYGGATRDVIASSFPQLSWLAPHAAPIQHSAPDTPVTLITPSPDQQQFNAMSLDLNAVRQSVDQIAVTQEQLTHSVDQLVSGQEQVGREITKLQAISQYVRYKNSEPPTQSLPARAPAHRTSQARTAR